jgi:hypothetical protein
MLPAFKTMTERNLQKERKLLQEWHYFKPIGPYMGDGVMKKNLNEMTDEDVERLIEIGDEMAEYIDGLKY